MSKKLTHLDAEGRASMVDVSDKPAVAREAVASGRIRLSPDTIAVLRKGAAPKGDVLAVARIAGIQAAKQCQNLIPLCHQIPLSKAALEFNVEDDGIEITATCKTVAQTGIEMEALTAVSVAGLTIYDMCKAIDKGMVIEQIKLLSKSKE